MKNDGSYTEFFATYTVYTVLIIIVLMAAATFVRIMNWLCGSKELKKKNPNAPTVITQDGKKYEGGVIRDEIPENALSVDVMNFFQHGKVINRIEIDEFIECMLSDAYSMDTCGDDKGEICIRNEWVAHAKAIYLKIKGLGDTYVKGLELPKDFSVSLKFHLWAKYTRIPGESNIESKSFSNWEKPESYKVAAKYFFERSRHSYFMMIDPDRQFQTPTAHSEGSEGIEEMSE